LVWSNLSEVWAATSYFKAFSSEVEIGSPRENAHQYGAPMQSTPNPKQIDDPHDILVVAPDVALVAPADEELSKLAHDALGYSPTPQTQTGAGLPAGASVPPVDTTFRPAAVDHVQVPRPRPSIGGRAIRAFAALLLAACIGVAAVAWQSRGDVARQILAKWAPQALLKSWLALDNPGVFAQADRPAVQDTAANPAPPQPASAQPPSPAKSAPASVAPAAAALSPDSAQLLQSMARDVATLGQQVEQLKAVIEQLKAGQQQMSRDIANASEQNPRPRMSPRASRSTAASARKPLPPNPPRQAAAAPAYPQAAAPYVPRQAEPEPQATALPQADPDLLSVPRPPMPLR
jgi:hypothetical protein